MLLGGWYNWLWRSFYGHEPRSSDDHGAFRQSGRRNRISEAIQNCLAARESPLLLQSTAVFGLLALISCSSLDYPGYRTPASPLSSDDVHLILLVTRYARGHRNAGDFDRKLW